MALDAPLMILVEERVWIVDQKPQADYPHLVLELKLHVNLDGVTAKSDIVRWIGFVSKGQVEPKLLSVERNRSLDVPRAENRVRFFEHSRLRTPIYHGGTDRKVLKEKMPTPSTRCPHRAEDLFAAGAATGHWGWCA
jgi:hypothetical protein